MAQPIWVGIVSWSGWLPMSSHLPLTSWPLLKPNDAFSHPEIAAAHRHTAVALLTSRCTSRDHQPRLRASRLKSR
jgi:hypothetical protein